MTFNKTGKVTGVKGFTYEIPSSGNASVFSASVKENANVWFRRYSNSAAFDASEEEFGSAASFAGQDTATIAPSSNDFDADTGEMYVVNLVPDGFEIGRFTSSVDSKGVAYDGKYLLFANASNHVYRLNKDFQVKDSFNATSGSSLTVVESVVYDGAYYWVGGGSSSTLGQFDVNGNLIKETTNLAWSTTQGLAWDGSYLYEADESQVHKFKTDFTEVETIQTPGSNPRGLTWDGKYLWTVDATAQTVYQFKKDGSEVSSFSTNDGNIWGLGWDGEYLYRTTNNGTGVYKLGSSNSVDISYQIGGIT